jgi:hypothetical protein
MRVPNIGGLVRRSLPECIMKNKTIGPKLHHFVPKSYLTRFSNDQGFLHVFDRSSDAFRRQRPKEVMKISRYYRQEWAPAGIDPNIFETTLGEWLEAEAKGALDRLISAPESLSEIDIANLINYFELQRIRVPRQGEMGKSLIRNVIMRLAPADIAAAIASGEFTLAIKDSARFDYMRMSIGTFHPWFGAMEWEVFAACTGASFVTSDSPVSLYNPRIPPPDEAGIALAGTMVFFPLSSRYVLVMRHPNVRAVPSFSHLSVLSEPPVTDGVISITHGGVWDADVVNGFNWKMMQLSDRLIVAESQEVLQACIAFHSSLGDDMEVI